MNNTPLINSVAFTRNLLLPRISLYCVIRFHQIHDRSSLLIDHDRSVMAMKLSRSLPVCFDAFGCEYLTLHRHCLTSRDKPWICHRLTGALRPYTNDFQIASPSISFAWRRCCQILVPIHVQFHMQEFRVLNRLNIIQDGFTLFRINFRTYHASFLLIVFFR